MMMELNIASKLDFAKLNYALERFEARQYDYTDENKYKPIIIMSPHTILDMSRIQGDYYDVRDKKWGVVDYYNGYKIFADSTMKYGEVQIR